MDARHRLLAACIQAVHGCLRLGLGRTRTASAVKRLGPHAVRTQFAHQFDQLPSHFVCAVPAPPVALWWREAVLSSPNLLKHLVKEQPQLCRQLLRRTSGIGPALCDVLVAHQLWLPSLYGVQPRYDAAALAAALAAPEAEREQALIRTAEGYAKPLFQPASGSVREVIFHLKSRPDLRRWPPAVQAQLRQLFTAVARMESAAPVQRKAALCLLARLQARAAGGHVCSPGVACWANNPMLLRWDASLLVIAVSE